MSSCENDLALVFFVVYGLHHCMLVLVLIDVVSVACGVSVVVADVVTWFWILLEYSISDHFYNCCSTGNSF